MAHHPDVDAMSPTLELTIDNVGPLLVCAGRLDVHTRGHVLDAVAELLERKPSHVTVDVGGLEVADSEGANALARVQRRARDAGISLDCLGLDADRFHKAPFCRASKRASLPASTSNAWVQRPAK